MDHQRVNEAIKAAEAMTSVEIVPVVATASGRYDRAEDIAGLWSGAAMLILVWFTCPVFSQTTESGDWGQTSAAVRIAILLATLVGGFIIGAVVASRLGWMRRLFTPAEQMAEEVAARARTIFFDQRVHHTTGASGLLIYVSLYEHVATILADRQVLDKLGQAAIDGLCRQLTAQLHEGTLTNAIVSTITEAGNQLGAAMPRAGDDVNELADALVVID